MQDINLLIKKVNDSSIPKDKKEYLINFINNTNNANLSESEKARKINIAVNALNAYITEKEMGEFKTLIAGTFKMSVDELTIPFKGIFDSLKFLTNPVVFVILVLVIFFLWYYFNILKKASYG